MMPHSSAPHARCGILRDCNKGLALVRGEWVAYLDSDNALMPQYIERMLAAVRAHPHTVFIFPKGNRFLELYQNKKLVQRIDKTSDEFGSDVAVQDIVHRKLHTDTNGLMHSQKVIDDDIHFDPDIPGMEDWEFMLTLSERYPGGFLYVNEILYTYWQRYGGDGLVSSRTYGDVADAFEYIYQKHKNDKLMAGQSWYPERVKKWRKLQADYGRGLIPPYQLWYFKEHWGKEFFKQSNI